MCVRYILRLATCDFNFAHIFWQIGKKITNLLLLSISNTYANWVVFQCNLVSMVSFQFLTNDYLVKSSLVYLIPFHLFFSRLNYYTLSDLYFFNCYGFLLLNVLVYMLVLIIGRSAKSRQEVIHYILHSIHK